jgi:hypothetical protein
MVDSAHSLNLWKVGFNRDCNRLCYYFLIGLVTFVLAYEATGKRSFVITVSDKRDTGRGKLVLSARPTRPTVSLCQPSKSRWSIRESEIVSYKKRELDGHALSSPSKPLMNFWVHAPAVNFSLSCPKWSAASDWM